jgi:hypothetical protein
MQSCWNLMQSYCLPSYTPTHLVGCIVARRGHHGAVEQLHEVSVLQLEAQPHFVQDLVRRVLVQNEHLEGSRLVAVRAWCQECQQQRERRVACARRQRAPGSEHPRLAATGAGRRMAERWQSPHAAAVPPSRAAGSQPHSDRAQRCCAANLSRETHLRTRVLRTRLRSGGLRGGAVPSTHRRGVSTAGGPTTAAVMTSSSWGPNALCLLAHPAGTLAVRWAGSCCWHRGGCSRSGRQTAAAAPAGGAPAPAPCTAPPAAQSCAGQGGGGGQVRGTIGHTGQLAARGAMCTRRREAPPRRRSRPWGAVEMLIASQPAGPQQLPHTHPMVTATAHQDCAHAPALDLPAAAVEAGPAPAAAAMTRQPL